MPIFEFRCRECGGQFELLVRGQERATCPSCSSTGLDRLMSAAAGHVAGSRSLPIAAPGCPPAGAAPCGPGCCRLPTH